MYTNKKLLEACRHLPCGACFCEDGTVVAAHRNQGKGMGIKVSDALVASLLSLSLILRPGKRNVSRRTSRLLEPSVHKHNASNDRTRDIKGATWNKELMIGTKQDWAT
jgi:hypothetical protein